MASKDQTASKQRRLALGTAIALLLSGCAATGNVVNSRQGLAGPAATRYYEHGVQKCVDVHRASGGADSGRCEKVVRTPDEDRGYVIKANEYPGHPADHYLLTPTAPISGIEDIAIRRPDWTNYWPIAWSEAERVVPSFWAARGLGIDRSRVSLAINATMTRSQDILHIHLSCVRPVVREALAKLPPETVSSQRWSDYVELQRVPGESGFYRVRWLRSLDENLFRIAFPEGERDPRNQSLAVVAAGSAAQDGYFVLASYYDKDHPDRGHAEDVQDHRCLP